MKITKYLHSCLLVEEDDKTVLIDPGCYSYDEKVLNIDSLSKLDIIAITHEHLDHMSIPFIKELLMKFPDVHIVSNDAVVGILAKENITTTTEGNSFLKISDAPHERIFMAPAPKNSMITLFQRLTHPGDSLHFETSVEILALPVQASWASLTETVEKALRVKPKIIIPIHDYAWTDNARETNYNWLEEYFKKFEIEFKKIKTGETILV